jgi:triosephosphate isomerase
MKKFVAGNWKMNGTESSSVTLARSIVDGLGSRTDVTVAVCPPFPYLLPVARVVRNTPVALGAQDVYHEKEGAFTGEVSPAMLLDCGCRYVIVGHSERRHKLGEDDALISRKVKAALEAGLQVILCVGELLTEREANKTEAVLERQLKGGLASLNKEQMGRTVIAYEPVWAIGTGKNATPEQAQEAHAFLRRQLSGMFGEETARAAPILYGGSATHANVASLLAQPDVNGGLVGGASLKADMFVEIVKIAAAIAK